MSMRIYILLRYSIQQTLFVLSEICSFVRKNNLTSWEIWVFLENVFMLHPVNYSFHCKLSFELLCINWTIKLSMMYCLRNIQHLRCLASEWFSRPISFKNNIIDLHREGYTLSHSLSTKLFATQSMPFSYNYAISSEI